MLDPRSVVLTVAGVFTGVIGTLFATLIVSAYSIWLGGDGSAVGLAIIAVSAASGLCFSQLVRAGRVRFDWATMLVLGSIVHVGCIATFNLLPSPVDAQLIEQVAIPYFLAFVPATSILGAVLNVAEANEATRRELDQSRQNLQYLFDHVPVSIWVEDFTDLYDELARLRTSGVKDMRAYFEEDAERAWALTGLIKVTDVNPATLDLFEAGSREQVVTRISETFQTESIEVFSGLICAIWNGERFFQKEVAYRTFAGKTIHTMIMIPLPIDRKQQENVPVSIVDLTERQEMIENLSAAKEEAERANRAKSHFLATMSHDLRTPLNAIVGFTDIMRTGSFGPLRNDKYVEYVDNIFDSGLLLVSLINDILDISRIESGRYALHEEDVDVEQLVQNCLAQVRPMTRDKDQKLLSSTGDVRLRVCADNRVLTQIVNNLLTNAVKYSPKGTTITVSAGLSESGGIQIAVADRGIGMSTEEITAALQPFTTIRDKSALPERSASEHSTGLGLYICDELTRLHGGELNVFSTPGHGTTVRLTFPAERTLPVDESPAAQAVH